MSQALNWIKARLLEPSTWAGIAAGATAVGVALQSNASLTAAVVAALVAIVKAEAGSQ